MKPQIVLSIILVYSLASTSSASVILNPVEDAHRLTDRNPPVTTNVSTINVVNSAWHVQTYLKFDLSQISDLNEVTSMTLRLYETTNGQSGSNFGADLEIIDLYFTTNHSWDETDREAPSVPTHNGQLLDSFNNTSAPGSWHSWDLSSYDLENDVVDSKLTLILLSNDFRYGWNMTTYISKENEQAEFWPQLILEGNISLVPEPSAFIGMACSTLLLIGFRGGRK